MTGAAPFFVIYTILRAANRLPCFFLWDIQFVSQTNANLDTLNKPNLLMVPAESTNSIDDLIDLLQRFPMHESVEFIEVGFDGCVIEAAGFVISIEQHLQDTLRMVGIVWLQGV